MRCPVTGKASPIDPEKRACDRSRHSTLAENVRLEVRQPFKHLRKWLLGKVAVHLTESARDNDLAY